MSFEAPELSVNCATWVGVSTDNVSAYEREAIWNQTAEIAEPLVDTSVWAKNTSTAVGTYNGEVGVEGLQILQGCEAREVAEVCL